MTAKEMFNELIWISDSWDGEHISFDKDRLEGYLQELETKLQNTSSSSDYAKCSKCGCQIENPVCGKCSFPTYDNTVKKHFA